MGLLVAMKVKAGEKIESGFFYWLTSQLARKIGRRGGGGVGLTAHERSHGGNEVDESCFDGDIVACCCVRIGLGCRAKALVKVGLARQRV